MFDRRVVGILRIALGALFLAAALPKLQDPAAFAKSVANYHLLPETPGRILALVLPPLELLVGAFLILGIFDAGASAIAFSLMLIFTLAVGAALARGLDISCGCFETEGGSKVGMKKIVENLLLIAAAWIVAKGDRSWLSFGAKRARRVATAAMIALVSIGTAHVAGAQQSATPKTIPSAKQPMTKRALPPMQVPPVEGPVRPFLWMIERGAEPPAFLFGTIHLPDPRVLQIPPIVDEAFRGSAVFVSEIPLTEETNKAIAAESIRGGTETLAMILPPDVRERADKFLQRQGFTLAEFAPLEIYTFAIQLPLLEYVRNPSPPMDGLLHSRAVTAGKTTKALETAAEQLAVFESLSREEQIELLTVTLDDLGDS
ncbi:MAG TPA: MauE/DoxX family redox-associated membrane protein, partial [bacterium]|nr:MauE/DoxX family redox-associated membrane protein [bacterium]